MVTVPSIVDSKPLPSHDLVAVILAGGVGSRWVAGGGDGHKLLARCNGQTVVWWAVQRALDAGLAVVVVTGAVQLLPDQLPHGVQLVHNPNWALGQSTSLAVGIVAARMTSRQAITNGVVVGLGDQPYIPTEAWLAVARAPRNLPIAVAVYEGKRGQPVRLLSEVWPLLPTDGDEGARTLIRVRHDLVIEVPCEGSPLQLTDIDTPGDIDTWN